MGRKSAAADEGTVNWYNKPWSWSATLVFSGLMTAATGAFLLAAPFLPDPGEVRADWLALGLLIGGLFTANMARMAGIWERLKSALETPPSRRLPPLQAVIRRGFRELFLWLILAMAALTALAFLSTFDGALPWDLGLAAPETNRQNPFSIGIFLGTLALAFLPPLIGTWLYARTEIRSRKNVDGKPARLFRDDAVSPASFYIGIVLIGGIGALANWAAGAADTGSAISGGLSMWITFIVISIFVLFIFVPHIGRFFTNQRERRQTTGRTVAAGAMQLEAPARLASWIDSALVRLVAPLSGATQTGVPHLLVILILLPLTALGFVLAAPWGLVPIALGMLLVAALGRRWAWIEEDRETASRLLRTDAQEIQIGFDNDLKDEALLGYAFLFILVPLALHQLWGWRTDAFEAADGADVSNAFFAWLSFFGAELAKAVPFVDWWEIYQVDLKRPIEPSETSALGKHLTFLSRAMVDLVIMAALFQAIGIWQRNRAQKRLYDVGQVNHFDPFTEREFFETAFLPGSKEPKAEFEKKVRDHVAAREALRLPGEPYDPQRLSDLLNANNPSVRKAALWMVDEFKMLTGPPQQQIGQLVSHWLNLSFPQLSGSQRQVDRRRLLNEKHKFEQLLAALDAETSAMRKSETGLLLGLLENIRQVPEFAFSQIEAIRLLGKLRNEYALLALAAHILPPAETQWRGRIQMKFGLVPNLYLGQAPMRLKVYEALEMFGLNTAVSPATRSKTLKLLDQMAESDSAIPCRERAALAARRIREKFGDVDLPREEDAPDDAIDSDDED